MSRTSPAASKGVSGRWWRAGLAALATLALPLDATAHADSVAAPSAFVAVPGRRAIVMGYPETGLEVWAYPLQVLSGYRLLFHEEGRVQPWEGRMLLRRVEVGPSRTVRVYVGPDFVVRERLSVPLNGAGARIDYEVEGRPDVRIEVRFEPSLNLMWPGALGNVSVGWDAARSAYVEREPMDGFSATIRAPDAVAHDDPVNAARDRSPDMALLLQPRPAPGGGPRRTSLIVTADIAGATGASSDSLEPADKLEAESAANAARVADESVRISTPDPAFDTALRDAETALDQAWVCAPRIGCGEVGGYGPSRPGRRPQYAWFFAGDGLVAADGLLASGRYGAARDELAFVTRFQNPSNGMIWHEMSLSAPWIDWSRYPYMYVHVDITLQYLAAFADYVEATGDTAFATADWPNLEAAWRYTRALIDPATGLPAIPPGKQGQNEQLKLRDDVRLSSAWIDAADGFARLARAAGKPQQAADALASAARARRALAAGAWDAGPGFWIGGHTLAGAVVRDERSDAVRLLQQQVFTPDEVDAVLDRLAAPAFRTDWGERSLPASAADYDPNAYSQGAVWGLGTSAAATAFWDAHRPLVGWSLLRGLADWNNLDSPGHLHEVLAGDLYHPEIESVPEQTWSSAGLLTGAIHGLFGLQVDGAARRLSFQPRLPGDWTHAEIDRVRVGAARLRLRLQEDGGSLALSVDNDGPPVAVDFAPEVPLGAHVLDAEVDGRVAKLQVETHPQEQDARIAFTAATGATRVVIRYAGGVRVAAEAPAPQAGDPSRDIKLGHVAFADGRLDVSADVADPARATVDLFTPWAVANVTGATVSAPVDGRVRLTLTRAPGVEGQYTPAHAVVTFASPAVQP